MTLSTFVAKTVFSFPTSSRILDLGCGFGRQIKFLVDNGYSNTTGCDLDKTKILEAKLNGLDVECCDALEYLNKHIDNSISCILCVDFLEHISKEIIPTYFAKISDKLVSGGLLIIRLPNPDSPFFSKDFFNDPTHQWCYTRDSLSLLLQKYDLDIHSRYDDRLDRIRRYRFLQVPTVYFSRLAYALAMVALGINHEVNTCISPSVWYVIKKRDD